jgi:hypothetical protein
VRNCEHCGQESQNQGVDFAAATGLQGVTRDPRDVGYPQVAFGGAYSVIGDPTTFVSRRNRSAELYENLLLDRGDHRFKFGAYVFRLAFNPVNPQAARGAFTYTGQWSGNAFADFLLGYPTSAQVGIGRADEHGRDREGTDQEPRTGIRSPRCSGLPGHPPLNA